MNKEQLIADLKAMSVLELAELVKALEEEFGVSAAAGAVVAAGPAAAAAEPVEEKTEFDVILKEVGPEKIKVIKVVRDQLLGVFLGNAFLDGGGSAIDHSLGFLEAQTGLLTDDLDDLDLLGADFLQDDVELGLLFHGLSGSGGGASGNDGAGGGGHAKLSFQSLVYNGGTTGSQRLDRLLNIGFAITPIIRGPFEAISRDTSQNTVLLTGMDSDQTKIIQKALIAAELSNLSNRPSVMIVQKKQNSDNIGTTALVTDEELKKIDDKDVLTDIILSRSTKK